eukprot:6923498-Prorocentrum_lima.AAC.1
MSTREHVGPHDPDEKAELLWGHLRQDQEKLTKHSKKGHTLWGQGSYTLEVLERCSATMNYRSRTTPG